MYDDNTSPKAHDNRFKPFEKLSDSEKLKRARQDFEGAISADVLFQKQARQAFRFYAGEHYTREELQELRNLGRPDLKFNMIKSTIELIKGVNEQNKIDVRAAATEQDDGFLADILNDCYDKIWEIEDIEMQADDALENNAITGRGFLAVDIAPDPKHPGEIKIPVVSILPSEVRIDPSCKKDDMSDARYVFWHKWISLEDFAIQYPDKVNEIEDIICGESQGDAISFETESIDEFTGLPVDTPDDEEYSTELETGYYDKSNGHIRIVHQEYWSTYDRYYAWNPETKQLEEFDKENLKTLERVFPNFQYEKIKDKKVRWFQFTGKKILFDGDSPIPYDGFSIVNEFAYKDKSTNQITHFGVVKDLIDPQREINKRISQTLNLYLMQHQGGNFIEQGAILDQKHWDDTVNQPGEDTFVADGSIAGQKIMPKPIPQLPVGAFQMAEKFEDLLKKVSGVNPDLLGFSQNANDPGVVIKLRQQQGLTLLAKLFKNHHRMQEQLAKRIYAIIMKWMPDSQIQRILGGSDRYKFRGDLVADAKNGLIAPIRKLRDLKYNIDVEESASNMTKTMAQLAIFMDMMAKGFPVDPKAVIARLDLPEDDKKEWEQFVDQTQQSQAQTQQMQMQAQQEQMQLQGQMVQNQMQDSQFKAQQAQARLQLDAHDKSAQRMLDLKKLQQEELSDRYDFTADMAKLGLQEQDMLAKFIQFLSAQAMQLPQEQKPTGPAAMARMN
jgi:hypothetical protein